jgi:hypothetical protein
MTSSDRVGGLQSSVSVKVERTANISPCRLNQLQGTGVKIFIKIQRTERKLKEDQLSGVRN